MEQAREVLGPVLDGLLVAAALIGGVLAPPALYLARRADRRESERGDVGWVLEHDDTGRVALTNTGRDVAKEARLVVTVDGMTTQGQPQTVTPGQVIAVMNPRRRTVIEEDRAEFAQEHLAWVRRRNQAGPWTVDVEPTHIGHRYDLAARITWRTQGGRWSVQELDEQPWT